MLKVEQLESLLATAQSDLSQQLANTADLQSALEMLESSTIETSADLARQASSSNARLESKLKTLQQALQLKTAACAKLNEELRSVKTETRAQTQRGLEETAKLQSQLSMLQLKMKKGGGHSTFSPAAVRKFGRLEAENDESKRALVAAKEQIYELEQKLQDHQIQEEETSGQLEDLKMQFGNLSNQASNAERAFSEVVSLSSTVPMSTVPLEEQSTGGSGSSTEAEMEEMLKELRGKLETARKDAEQSRNTLETELAIVNDTLENKSAFANDTKRKNERMEGQIRDLEESLYQSQEQLTAASKVLEIKTDMAERAEEAAQRRSQLAASGELHRDVHGSRSLGDGSRAWHGLQREYSDEELPEMPASTFDPSIQGQAQTARFQHAATAIGEMEGALLQAADIIAAHQQNAGLVAAQAEAQTKAAVAEQTRAAAAAAAAAQVQAGVAAAASTDGMDALGRRLLAELQRPLDVLTREVGSGHQQVASLAQAQQDLANRLQQLAQETKVAQAEAAHRAAEAAHAAALLSETQPYTTEGDGEGGVYGMASDSLVDGGNGNGAGSRPKTIAIFDTDSDSDAEDAATTAGATKAAAQAAASALAAEANGGWGGAAPASALAATGAGAAAAAWLPPPDKLVNALQGTLALVKSQSRQIRELEVQALLRAQGQHYAAQSATHGQVATAAAGEAPAARPLFKIGSVQLVASKASRHLGLQAGTPSFALAVSASGVSLEDGASGKQLIRWPFSLVSRYGLMGGLVSMETRGSSRGVPGVFHFGAGDKAAELYRRLKASDELSTQQR